MDAAQFQRLLEAQKKPTRRVKELSSVEPTDWIDWRHNFEIAATINGWNETRKRREIGSSMMGLVKRAVRDIPLEAEPAAGAADAEAASGLLDAYEARLLPEAASDLARESFHAAAQYDDEQTLSWHGRLRDLYLRAYPEMTAAMVERSRDLRDHFLKRMKNRRVAELAYLKSAATYSEALNHATKTEAATLFFAGKESSSPSTYANQSLFAMGQGSSQSTRGGYKRDGQRRNFRRDSSAAGTSKGACHNCGRTGHQWRDCKLPVKDPKAHAEGYRNRVRRRDYNHRDSKSTGWKKPSRSVNQMGNSSPVDPNATTDDGDSSDDGYSYGAGN